jgi:hypothetical protein
MGHFDTIMLILHHFSRLRSFCAPSFTHRKFQASWRASATITAGLKMSINRAVYASGAAAPSACEKQPKRHKQPERYALRSLIVPARSVPLAILNV